MVEFIRELIEKEEDAIVCSIREEGESSIDTIYHVGQRDALMRVLKEAEKDRANETAGENVYEIFRDIFADLQLNADGLMGLCVIGGEF